MRVAKLLPAPLKKLFGRKVHVQRTGPHVRTIMTFKGRTIDFSVGNIDPLTINLEYDRATQKTLRETALAFAPLVRTLNRFVPPDADGRGFSLVTHAHHDLETGRPVVKATIGYFTGRENEAAWLFGIEGMNRPYLPEFQLARGHIESLSYTVTVPVERNAQRVYQGYAPANGAGKLEFFESGDFSRICDGLFYQFDLAEKSQGRLPASGHLFAAYEDHASEPLRQLRNTPVF